MKQAMRGGTCFTHTAVACPKSLVKLVSAFECDQVFLDDKSLKFERSIFCELNLIETLINESCIDG